MTRRIVVVEDDEKSRRLLTDVLTHQGYLVTAVSCGEDGIRAAREGADAVLLDVQLPGIDGFEVLAGLRKAPSTAPYVPVVAVTASVMDQDRRKILAAGFDAYVPKPVNIRELLATLTRLLAGSPT
jgi:CheY-like chemotaxis protein